MLKLHKRFFAEFQSSFMLMIPLSIIVQSCFGSIVALYVLSQGGDFFLLKLAIITILCMTYNASILAQLKVVYVYNLLWASLLCNTLVLLITVI